MVSLVWWLDIYRRIGEPLWYAVLYPLGGAVIFYIFLRAVIRGQNVQWKGRDYVST